MDAGSRDSGGGVDVKPTSNGQVHAENTAASCSKPSLYFGKVSLHVATAEGVPVILTRMERAVVKKEVVEDLQCSEHLWWISFHSIPKLLGLARVTQHETGIPGIAQMHRDATSVDLLLG